MIGVGMIRNGWRSGGRGMRACYASASLVVAVGRGDRHRHSRATTSALARRSCRRWCRPCWRALPRADFPGCGRRRGKAAGSWIEIEGFKQYLSVAEEDRLEYLNPPEKTPELFEKFLPYAIALNVENTWAKRFTGGAGRGRCRRRGVVVVQRQQRLQHHDRASVARFTDRVGDSLSTTIAAAATPPGSTGSSGWSSGGGGDFGGGSSGGGAVPAAAVAVAADRAGDVARPASVSAALDPGQASGFAEDCRREDCPMHSIVRAFARRLLALIALPQLAQAQAVSRPDR